MYRFNSICTPKKNAICVHFCSPNFLKCTNLDLRSKKQQKLCVQPCVNVIFRSSSVTSVVGTAMMWRFPGQNSSKFVCFWEKKEMSEGNKKGYRYLQLVYIFTFFYFFTYIKYLSIYMCIYSIYTATLYSLMNVKTTGSAVLWTLAAAEWDAPHAPADQTSLWPRSRMWVEAGLRSIGSSRADALTGRHSTQLLNQY